MPSSPTAWWAFGDGWAFSWADDGVFVDASEDALIAAVVDHLESLEVIDVTPTGPSVTASVEDPRAVRAALAAVAPGPYSLAGNPPALPAIPDDADA